MSRYADRPRFGKDEIEDFLRSVDRHLRDRCSIVLLGGAAIAMHRANITTIDIDTYNTHAQTRTNLDYAITVALEESRLDIPMSDAGVAEVPYFFEIVSSASCPISNTSRSWSSRNTTSRSARRAAATTTTCSNSRSCTAAIRSTSRSW
jgi:hypothetical protein